ncbi:MAG TPA: SPOR domain-containing protein [Thiothrix sp.]|nr:SPOR domain-containing protein [Thiothrix sp.]
MKGMIIVSMKKQALLVLVSVFMLASCTTVNEGTVSEVGGGVGVGVGVGGGGASVGTPTGEIYVVQLIASSSKPKADRIRDQFVNDGYQAVVSTITSTTGLLHRVQIGAYSNEADALRALNEMRLRYKGVGNVHVNNAVVKTK